MRGNTEVKETHDLALVQQARAKLVGLLPPRWKVAVQGVPRGGGDARYRPDAFFRVTSPDGTEGALAVEAKTAARRGWTLVLDRLTDAKARSRCAPLAVVDYAGPGFRRSCETRGVNYMDLTGWVSLSISQPAVLIRTTGATRDPVKRRPSAIQRLSGPGAGRIMRTLLSTAAPRGVREIAKRASVRAGTVSKVLATLGREGLVTRGDAGEVRAVGKRALVERWAQDYGVLRTNRAVWYLAPRGFPRLLERLATPSSRAAATGSLALRAYLEDAGTAVTALAQLALYVPDPESFARQVDLEPMDRSRANVVLLEPYDPDLLQTASTSAVGRVVDAGQAVVDVYTGPGRGPEEAEQMMDRLAQRDPAWR